ncbi:MAG: MBL fold metallo-hydrolase [Bacteroidia bacterium]
MKITLLGTGTSQGVPVIACGCEVCMSTNPKDKRLRCSLLIEENENVIVIDSGPDFRQQMLRENVKRLDGLVFTHEHKDHVAGMDDIRAFNFFNKKPVDIYATERVQKELKREFTYVFDGSQYPGIPQVNINTIENKPFNVAGVELIPFEVLHYKLPVLGFRIKDFVYITDANFIAEEERKKIRAAKILIINALRREEHISHFTLSQAIEIIEDLKPEQAYLTHISHQLGLHDEVEKELPANVHLAFDGLSFGV